MQVIVRILRKFYEVSCPHCLKPLRLVKMSECYGVVEAAREAVKARKGRCWVCGASLTGFEQE